MQNPNSCNYWLNWRQLVHCNIIGYVTLVAITGTIVLMSYLCVKSLQLLSPDEPEMKVLWLGAQKESNGKKGNRKKSNSFRKEKK